MANETFNFPCWQHHDRGLAVPRLRHGMGWEIGPGAWNPSVQPFSTEMTMIFSFLFRENFSPVDNHADANEFHGLFGLGQSGVFTEDPAMRMWCSHDSSGDFKLRLKCRQFGVADRYSFEFGDEDGINWLQYNKWYQCGISISASGITHCINGSVTPTLTETTNVPGALSLNAGSERFIIGTSSPHGPKDLKLITGGWPCMPVGVAAFDRVALDFNSATVRAKIWDENGDFKNPGEDGSLWFGDLYDDYIPDFLFPDGVPNIDRGKYNVNVPQIFTTQGGGGSGFGTAMGGLKKQYE